MSAITPIMWAMKNAPVNDVQEWAVLAAQAEAADRDGCNSFLSTASIAKRTRMAPRTVQRRIDDMLSRGLIALGDQNAPELMKLPANYRPVNYTLMVPASAYGDDGWEDMNNWRLARGRAALDPADRPDHAPAPERQTRKDAGVSRAEGLTQESQVSDAQTPEGTRGDYKSPLADEARGDSQSPLGVTTSQAQGCPTVTQPTPITNPPTNETPIVPADAATTGSLALSDRELELHDAAAQATALFLVEEAPADDVPTFEDFYAAYPRKKAPAAARKAWDKAIKAGADPAAIVEGAKLYRAEREGQDPGWTKYPASWLNAQCWLDEPDAPWTDPRGHADISWGGYDQGHDDADLSGQATTIVSEPSARPSNNWYDQN